MPRHRTCRLCLSKQNKAWVSPCACKGTMKWVHADCLGKERARSPTPDQCSVCHGAYPTRPIAPTRHTWIDVVFPTLTILAILVITAGSMAYMLHDYLYRRRHTAPERECATWPLMLKRGVDELWPGECLGVLSPLESRDGSHVLILERGPRLVFYNRDKQIAHWQIEMDAHEPVVLVMQRDGNLVVYTQKSGKPLWATGTYSPGARARLLSSRLEILSADDEVIWPSTV